MKEFLKASVIYASIAGAATIGVRVTNDLYNKVKSKISNRKQKAQ